MFLETRPPNTGQAYTVILDLGAAQLKTTTLSTLLKLGIANLLVSILDTSEKVPKSVAKIAKGGFCHCIRDLTYPRAYIILDAIEVCLESNG